MVSLAPQPQPIASVAFTFESLQIARECEEWCDTRIEVASVDSPAQLYPQSALVINAWASLQEHAWTEQSRENILTKNVAIPMTLMWDASKADKEDANLDTEQIQARLRQAVRLVSFMAVAKIYFLNKAGAVDADNNLSHSTPIGASLKGITVHGVPLDDVCVTTMDERSLAAVLENIEVTHHLLEPSPNFAHFLKILLRRCTEVLIMTRPQNVVPLPRPSGLQTQSLGAYSDEIAKRGHTTHLLALTERVFAGLMRDSAHWHNLPERIFIPVVENCQMIPSREEANRAWLTLIAGLSVQKQMQREVIAAREQLLACALCPYGRERSTRHGLKQDGRTKLATEFDRLCYRQFTTMIDEDGKVNRELDLNALGIQAALFATCVVVLEREFGQSTVKWLQNTLFWSAECAENNHVDQQHLKLHRIFNTLVDNEGEKHDNIILFLAKVSSHSVAQARIPHEIRARLI